MILNDSLKFLESTIQNLRLLLFSSMYNILPFIEFIKLHTDSINIEFAKYNWYYVILLQFFKAITK